MKTIRGKTISFFILCLAFAGALALLNYQNVFSLKDKIYAIERFDDLLNNVLELRRYEKNILFYKDSVSLAEAGDYLNKVDRAYTELKEQIIDISGDAAYAAFGRDLVQYRQTLGEIIDRPAGGDHSMQSGKLRPEGKQLVDFAQQLIQKKRRRIDQVLQRMLVIPLISIGFLIILAVVIFRLVTRGILQPLQMVERATEKVAKESFTPIAFDKDKQDEITHLIASFNQMVAELDSRQEQLIQSRKLASIGTLTSGIAHELNNPLNNISITAEAMMLNHPDVATGEIGEMMEDIMAQADRASQVVKNLLEFSRTELPRLRRLDIADLLERCLNLIKNQFVVAQVRIEKTMAPNLPAIFGKRQDLQQAFVNILLNAVQAMPHGGTIRIKGGLGPQGFIRIDLADTGSGIGPDALEHIFDPFFTTKDSGQGTGLGLSIVYNIIRTHGGYIEVQSEVEKGTVFSIFLPIITGKEAAEDDVQSSRCG